jgi:hypothetical protein
MNIFLYQMVINYLVYIPFPGTLIGHDSYYSFGEKGVLEDYRTKPCASARALKIEFYFTSWLQPCGERSQYCQQT